MESRKERPAAPAPLRRSRPLALIFGLAAIFVASGYLLLRNEEKPFDPATTVASANKPAATAPAAPRAAPATSAPTIPTSTTPSPAPPTAAGAAVEPAKIVLDDDNPFDAGDPAADKPADKPSAKPVADAPRQVASATPPKAVAKPVVPASTRVASATGKRRGAAKNDDDGLMAVLLGNIDTDAESGGKRKAKVRNRNAKEDQDALEQLIRKVNAESAAEAKKNAAVAAKSAPVAGKALAKNAAEPNARNVAKSGAKPAKAAEAAAPATPVNPVQASLRKCPKANTARGLQCRQKVCAKYAGQDPACPAQ